MARTLNVARSEIRRDRLQRWDEMEIERKIHEDEAAMRQRGIEGGDDDVKQ